MSQVPGTPPRRRSAGYLVVRLALAGWGGMVLMMAVAAPILRTQVASERDVPPLGLVDRAHLLTLVAMGLLLVLPFRWLARRTLVRRVLILAAALALSRIAWSTQTPSLFPGLVRLLVLTVPCVVAIVMIHRQRRGPRVDYGAVFD